MKRTPDMPVALTKTSKPQTAEPLLSAPCNSANHSTVNRGNQSDTAVLFEYPVTEQIRGFLRLEALFQQFERNRDAPHEDNHLHALKTLFEILEILERGDTRAELTKELARLANTYTRLRQNPDIDVEKLDTFLMQINQLQQWSVSYRGKFGDKLRKTPFIENVKHRLSIPGGACHFDCPDLFLFFNRPIKARQMALQGWLDDIKGVKTSIEVILRMVRENTQWKNQHSPLGSFMIDMSGGPFQLLRLKFFTGGTIFPKLSCGRHRGHIHFMRFDEDGRTVPVRDGVDFELACCF